MSRGSFPDLVALVDSLRRGELDLPDLLERLEARCDEAEPQIHALVPEAGRFERLRREARELLRRFPEPGARPPLFGLPVGVKDIFRVEGLPTRAGSRLPPAEFEGAEAAAVSALRAAGALVLGKTVSTEFAYFAPGPTRNPRDPRRTPGGSSSGSAAAVAAGLCPLALGTQTIGSISRPASFCGVAGYKPSYDRISKEGVIPLSPSLDHVGLFAAGVSGIEAAAPCLCTEWRQIGEAGRPLLGVPEGPYLERASAAGLEHLERTGARLAAAGFELRRVGAMADFEEIERRHNRIVAAEAARVHRRWYPQYRDLYHPKTAELIGRGRKIAEEELADDLSGRDRLRAELTAVMSERGIDLWVSPAAPGPAPLGLESTGDPVMNLPWTHAGLPTLALPAGRDEGGLPMGLQLAGRWDRDEALLAWGEGIEEAVAGMVGPPAASRGAGR